MLKISGTSPATAGSGTHKRAARGGRQSVRHMVAGRATCASERLAEAAPTPVTAGGAAYVGERLAELAPAPVVAAQARRGGERAGVMADGRLW